MKTFLSLLAVAFLSGCATHYSTSDTKDGKPAIIYRLSESQALSLIATNMAISFPAYRIKEIDGPVKGYSARFRVALDTWDTTVLAVPVAGRTQDGHLVKGYRFDISGNGTLIISGRGKTANLKKRLFNDLNQSGTGVAVTSVHLTP